jgi:hypothetical protein
VCNIVFTSSTRPLPEHQYERSDEGAARPASPKPHATPQRRLRVLAQLADEQLVEDDVPARTWPRPPSAPLATVTLSAHDKARLDLPYQWLIELGLRRRVRHAKAAL